jgi:hypothetical protein
MDIFRRYKNRLKSSSFKRVPIVHAAVGHGRIARPDTEDATSVGEIIHHSSIMTFISRHYKQLVTTLNRYLLFWER